MFLRKIINTSVAIIIISLAYFTINAAMKLHYNNIFNNKIEKQVAKSQNYLVLLNSPNFSFQSIKFLWNKFEYVICADGSANRLYDNNAKEDISKFIPHYIKGDLDSIREDVKNYYSSKGTVIIQDEDQDKNDLEKCLTLVNEMSQSNFLTNISIYIYGAFGGRFDQEMSSFHSLINYITIQNNIVLFDDKNLVRYIYPNTKNVYILDKTIEGPICGIIPIYGEIEKISTKGFKWDLSNHTLGFGKLVSSSNEFVGIDQCNHSQGYNSFSASNNNIDIDLELILDNDFNKSEIIIVEIETNHPGILTYEISFPSD